MRSSRTALRGLPHRPMPQVPGCHTGRTRVREQVRDDFRLAELRTRDQPLRLLGLVASPATSTNGGLMNPERRVRDASVRRLRNRARQVATADPSPSGWRGRIRRPVVWLGVAVLAGAAAFVGTWVEAYLDSRIGTHAAEGEPVHVVAVQRDENHLEPYIVPTEHITDELAADLEDDGSTAELPGVDGTIPVESVRWEILLRGNHSGGVVITDMRPVLAEPCADAADGLFIANYPQAEGTVTELFTVVDEPTPAFYGEYPVYELGWSTEWDEELAEWSDDPTQPSDKFFTKKYIKLAKDEQHLMSFKAIVVGNQHCRWTVEADVSSGEQVQTFVITAPGGKPFELSGMMTDVAGYDGLLMSNCSPIEGEWFYVSGEEYVDNPDYLRRCAGPLQGAYP